MPCFHPWQAYRKEGGGITANKAEAWGDLPPFTLPCGGCIGCRLDKAQDWATRMHHEASLHDYNSFLTLTYSNECLPDSYSVSVREMQTFLKRLRKAIEPVKIRFFACGEYGDQGGRPHYHLIIFGYAFPDRYLWGKSEGGYLTYRSPLLETVWTSGISTVQDVTYQSTGYCARYLLKKINGDMAVEHYRRIHPLTGELVQVEREFATMSRMPGLGHSWFQQFRGDVFPDDFVVIDGKRRPIPRYYKLRLEEREQTTLLTSRKKQARKHQADNTPDRLAVRETCAQLRAKTLKRTLDHDPTSSGSL